MADHVIVNVAQGALRGCRVTSKGGWDVYRFQGIPYAAPPVGELRFKAPEPALPWSGVRDALEEGNVCTQISPMLHSVDGEEDCLFLNIFAPELPTTQGPKKPVMVFIHGGGFANGGGNSILYNPEMLVDQGVVVVTFNYRLGPLGFLTTEDGEIPGNAGMKDQVAALRWVKQNISQFGGDPDNVTIFGESAGGASVHYHLLSPMSRELFHRAISQSGSALNSWAFSRVGRSHTVRLAKVLGCKSEDSKDILAFLRGIPAQQLVEKQNFAISEEEKRRAGELLLPFVPTIEAKHSGSEEKFLVQDPIDIIESGNFAMVPYITGVNTNEGLFFVGGVGDKKLRKIDADFERVLPEDLFPQIGTTNSKEAARKLKKFFFGNEPLCEKTLSQYSDLKSDTMFGYMINKTVQLHALKSTAPLYYYQFAFDGSLGFFKHYFLSTDIPGVCHADELGYLFNQSIIEIECADDSPEKKVSNMLVKMWTNFAKTGDPSTDIAWHPVSSNKLCYLRIDHPPAMREDMDGKRMAFWEGLYRAYKKTPQKKSKL